MSSGDDLGLQVCTGLVVLAGELENEFSSFGLASFRADFVSFSDTLGPRLLRRSFWEAGLFSPTLGIFFVRATSQSSCSWNGSLNCSCRGPGTQFLLKRLVT
jgi:hypothetical protein